MAAGGTAQIMGTVVDVEFPPDALPPIYNAVEVSIDGHRLVLEVEQHVGNNWVRRTTADTIRRGDHQGSGRFGQSPRSHGSGGSPPRM